MPLQALPKGFLKQKTNKLYERIVCGKILPFIKRVEGKRGFKFDFLS